jgi:hypothetical protein
MRRLASALLAAGGLLLLASLYLPWQKGSCHPAQCGVGLLLGFVPETQTIDGWSSPVGGAVALVALPLVALAAGTLVRTRLADRSPLGLSALLTAYFAFALAAEARSSARDRAFGPDALHFHYSYGAYLGVAAGVIVLLTAVALRRDELVRPRSTSRVAAIVLTAGLLVSYLLPWQRFAAVQHLAFLGIESPAAVVAAVTICLSALGWATQWTAGERLGISAAAALFTAAAVTAVTLGVARAYGAWLGLGLALALVAIALRRAAPISPPRRPAWHVLATAAAAAVFLTALFLPWQQVCYPTGSDFGRYAGRCLSTDGWVSIAGSMSAALAILLLVAMLAPRRVGVAVVELAIGIALLVATVGFELAAPSGFGVRFGYGAIVGFGAAALLLVFASVRPRRPSFDRHRMLVRLPPIIACLAYLAIVVLPWWDVLPRRLQSQSLVRFAPLSWLTVAGSLLAVHLVGSWARRIVEPAESADRLVLLPIALLALAALDLIRLRDAGITWGGGIVVGLCVLLALLGRTEQREGLESLRVPEVLRVDRL